jgi:hypothetical protein
MWKEMFYFPSFFFTYIAYSQFLFFCFRILFNNLSQRQYQQPGSTQRKKGERERNEDSYIDLEEDWEEDVDEKVNEEANEEEKEQRRKIQNDVKEKEEKEEN